MLAGALVAAAPLAAQAPGSAGDEEAVLAVVERLFDGMREKDEALLRGVWHQEARLQTAGAAASDAPRLRSTPVEAFVTSVLSSGAVLDEVTFDKVVRISGDLATVWAPYNLFVDGDFSHCGVDAIQMVRSPGGWLIHQLTDTRTQVGCDPDRRGDGA
jgi:hypothetical protein